MPQSRVFWADSCRLVPSRYPPIALFETVADPADLDVVFAIESLGNPCIREQVGELDIVPKDQRVSGPGTGAIMAAFTHLNVHGSRFTDGTYGVYYAGKDLETAIAEVSYHRARFLSHTSEPAIDIDMRCYRVMVDARLINLRGKHAVAELVDPDSYVASQAFARMERAGGGEGIVYDSVRREGGQCVALFTPKAMTPPARQAEHVTLQWNGERIIGWYLKSDSHPI